MQGEATPNYPAAHDNLAALVAFIKDVKACDAWLKNAGATIQRNEALLKTIGKASQIDKLHAEAAELKDKVLTEIEKRETALAGDRKTFDDDMKRKRAESSARQAKSEGKARQAADEANSALSRANANEAATKAALKNAQDHEAKAQKVRDNVTGIQTTLKAQQKAVKALADQVGV